MNSNFCTVRCQTLLYDTSNLRKRDPGETGSAAIDGRIDDLQQIHTSTCALFPNPKNVRDLHMHVHCMPNGEIQFRVSDSSSLCMGFAFDLNIGN